jgi:hypothetical protein
VKERQKKDKRRREKKEGDEFGVFFCVVLVALCR